MANKIPNGFRTTFTYDKNLHWFPGHMAKSLRKLKEGIADIDMVIEVRDARIPLSSVNTKLEQVLGRRERLIIYNKADLANPNYQKVK